MALLSGTAAQVALDLLRSGRAFEKDGVKMFERALKATQRGQVPEGAVSEFRKLIDGLQAEAIQRRIVDSRARKPQRNFSKDSAVLAPWSTMRMESSYIPKSVNYWTNFIVRNPASRFDQDAVNWFKMESEVADKRAAETLLEGLAPRSAEYSEPAYMRRRSRQSAVEDRTNATIVEALMRLFGEKGPV